MAPLKHKKLYAESYNLFLKIMANVNLDNWLWRPAELSLSCAFKWDTSRPLIGNPASLVHFLEHCLSEQGRDIVVNLPVDRVMLALADAPSEAMSKELTIDFTRPLFFNRICQCLALRDDVPHLLRRATITFLPHLDAQFFNTNKTFSEDQVNEFISAWFSSAEESLGKEHDGSFLEALFATLMGLLDSPLWRKHIPRERWSFLTSLKMVEGPAPPSFYRCANNSAIIPSMEEAGVRSPKFLAHWAGILWARYPDLSKDVRRQLEKVTKRTPDEILSTYLATVEGQIQHIKGKLDSHVRSPGEVAANLEERLGSFGAARRILTRIQKTGD
jgi:hypothetical protein